MDLFLALPEELQSHIISYVTDPKEIATISLINRHLLRVTRQSIVKIDIADDDEDYDDRGLKVSYLMRFPSLRIVEDSIEIKTIGDLMFIANLRFLRYAQFDFDGSYLKRFNPDFSLIQFRSWVIAFIQQYCGGLYVNTDGVMTQHHRTLLKAEFNFDIFDDDIDDLDEGGDDDEFYTVTIDRGILSSTFISDDMGSISWIRPIIETLHEFNSMAGFALDRWFILEHQINWLFTFPEFHQLVFMSKEGSHISVGIEEFLWGSKIDTLIEDYIGEPAVEDNTQLLLSLPSSSLLKVAELPVAIDSLQEIVEKLPLLEAVDVYVPMEGEIADIVETVINVLRTRPTLKIDLWVSEQREPSVKTHMETAGSQWYPERIKIFVYDKDRDEEEEEEEEV